MKEGLSTDTGSNSRRKFLGQLLALTGIPAIAKGNEKDLRGLVYEIGSMMLEKREKKGLAFDEMLDAPLSGKKTASLRFTNFNVNGLEDVDGFRNEIEKMEGVGELAVYLSSKFSESIEDIKYDLYVDANLENSTGPRFTIYISGTGETFLGVDGSTWNTEEAIVEGLTLMFKKIAVAKARAIEIKKGIGEVEENK